MSSDAIRDLELQILQKEIRRDECAEALKDVEKQFSGEIEALWEQDKIKAYSNAQKRADACKARLAADPKAAALDDERSELEIDLKRLRIDVSFLRREFRREMIRRQEALAGIGEDI